VRVIHLTGSLRASQKSRTKYEADFLVDTGATDCMAPASKLKKAGISRSGRMSYELADGSTVEYDFGLVVIEFMGELTAGRVVFGPENCEPLLGVTALESVGITVDPANRQLKRLPAIPLKQNVRCAALYREVRPRAKAPPHPGQRRKPLEPNALFRAMPSSSAAIVREDHSLGQQHQRRVSIVG
jgi:clan AA aspartic protease